MTAFALATTLRHQLRPHQNTKRHRLQRNRNSVFPTWTTPCAWGLKAAVTPFQSSQRPHVPIAVIDDERFEYFDILRGHGFNITVYKDVNDVKQLEAYAIILCDIKGVGKHFKSAHEGAHLIQEIRRYYPQKLLYAFTGQQFDASYNKYFAQCDHVIKKDINSDTWVDHLDDAIKCATDPISQWRKLRSYLLSRDVAPEQLMRLEDEYVTSVLANRKFTPRDKLLKTLPEDGEPIVGICFWPAAHGIISQVREGQTLRSVSRI